MDRSGKIVDEEDAVGCKVTHDLLKPEMCIVMDEVGGNTSQKGDGNIGGELKVCAQGMVPQQKINTRDKHWTLLGVTSLRGDPVMCVIIFAGKRENTLTETGMDIFVDAEGDPSDHDYFEKNSGFGKQFPGGPTCEFQGKEVPCLCRWSEKGSVTSAILVDILATLDHYEIFDRSNGAKQFLLLDGHGSRLETPFLSYINYIAHEWVVCIGVPYGTLLWQVGDSSQQNGAYNMALARIKKSIIEKKEERMMPLMIIEPHEIVIMVNYAWSCSFARTNHNKEAILHRGWSPLNRKIILDKTISATMTDAEKTNENNSGDVTVPYHVLNTVLDLSEPTVLYDPKFTQSQSTENETLTIFLSGTAAWCLQSILRDADLHKAQEKIRQQRCKGQSLKDRIKEGKKVTDGKLFLAGSCRLGKTVFDVVRESKEKHQQALKEKQNKAYDTYQKKVEKAEALKAQGKPNQSLTNDELKILLAPLKRRGDGAMPTKKEMLLQKLMEWGNRGMLPPPAVEAPTPAFQMMDVDEFSESEENMDDVLETMTEAQECADSLLCLYDSTRSTVTV